MSKVIDLEPASAKDQEEMDNMRILTNEDLAKAGLTRRSPLSEICKHFPGTGMMLDIQAILEKPGVSDADKQTLMDSFARGHLDLMDGKGKRWKVVVKK